MTTTDAARVAEARRWFRQQGQAVVEDGGVTLVATPADPNTWEANFVMAAPGAAPGAVLAALDRGFTHSEWRVVQVDCLTDPAVEAALALAGFRAPGVVIEMVARAIASLHPLPTVALRRVGDAEWPVFAALADIDMREGRRTGDHDERVAAGLLPAMRRRMGTCTFWLLDDGGTAAGYGMTVRCPNGLGLIESLFTLPGRRRRGLMSRFIVEAARRLRAEGCDAVFLDAHAHDSPRHLYARLGFAPVAVTRTWVKKVA